MPADMEMVMTPAVVPKFSAHIYTNENWTNMFDFMFDTAWHTKGRTELISAVHCVVCLIQHILNPTWWNTAAHWLQTMMLYLPV